jgi:hypothetical protein
VSRHGSTHERSFTKTIGPTWPAEPARPGYRNSADKVQKGAIPPNSLGSMGQGRDGNVRLDR